MYKNEEEFTPPMVIPSITAIYGTFKTPIKWFNMYSSRKKSLCIVHEGSFASAERDRAANQVNRIQVSLQENGSKPSVKNIQQ